MLKSVLMCVAYNLVSMAIGMIPEQFDSDLSNWEANNRVRRFSSANITYSYAKEIFHKYPNVQQIVTTANLYTLTCDKRTKHIDVFNSMTLEPERFNDIAIIDLSAIDTDRFDVNLSRCLKLYCALSKSRAVSVNCSNQGILSLRIKYDEHVCYRTVYDVNLQSNLIKHVYLQSFAQLFVYVVRLDLRNNPILTLAYDSFDSLYLLRFLYLPCVKNVINEIIIKNLMKSSTRLLFVECDIDTSPVIYGWNDNCKQRGVQFFYVNHRITERSGVITEGTSTITEGTRPITERTRPITEGKILITEETSTITEETRLITEITPEGSVVNKWLLFGFAVIISIILIINIVTVIRKVE